MKSRGQLKVGLWEVLKGCHHPRKLKTFLPCQGSLNLFVQANLVKNEALIHEKWLSQLQQQKVELQHLEIPQHCEDGSHALEEKGNLIQVC